MFFRIIVLLCSILLFPSEIKASQPFSGNNVEVNPTAIITESSNISPKPTVLVSPTPAVTVSATPIPTIHQVKSAIAAPTAVPTPTVKAAETQRDNTSLFVIGFTASILAVFSGGYLLYWGNVKN